MPAGTVDVSVDGEWSFAQTLRHLVMATDTWLGKAVLGLEQPYHPLGQPNAEYETDGTTRRSSPRGTPTYDEVLAVRAEPGRHGARPPRGRHAGRPRRDAPEPVGAASTPRPSAPACT